MFTVGAVRSKDLSYFFLEDPVRKSTKHSKRPRLEGFDYKGSHAYFLTIGTFQKVRRFTTSDAVSLCLSALRGTAHKTAFDVLAYCFMPDHVHLLVSGLAENSDLQKFVRLFKQKSGYDFKKRTGLRLWATSYYDRILRKEEGVEKVARYIWANPVRKSLVEDYRDYPYSGSFEYDMENL